MLFKINKERRRKQCKKLKTVIYPELLRGEWANNCQDDPKYNTKDEYYTKFEDVKTVFEKYIDTTVLKDKVLWLPCDTEQSEFYKWLITHKDEYKYKELIMTSDDMFTHDDILKKTDIVIDNVPFSRACDILDMFREEITQGHNIQFFIFYNMFSLPSAIDHVHGIDNITMFGGSCACFDTPHDEKYNTVASIMFMTNMKLRDDMTLIKPKSNGLTCDDYESFVYGRYKGEDIPVFDTIREIPIDYDGWFLSPVTSVLYKNCFEHEFEERHIKSIIYTDGQARFVRLKTRWLPQHNDYLEIKTKKKVK